MRGDRSKFALSARGKSNCKLLHQVHSIIKAWVTILEIRSDRASENNDETLYVRFERNKIFLLNFRMAKTEAVNLRQLALKRRQQLVTKER